MSSTTNSVGIAKWAGTQSIEIAWQTGTGDARLTGWERTDGARAIETNGDPLLEGDDGFEALWCLRGACSTTEPREYTYSIFDADPNTGGNTAWPAHDDVAFEADSDEEAIEHVRDVMNVEAAGLNSADGYDVGQSLYSIVWGADEIIVGTPTYELTADDLD